MVGILLEHLVTLATSVDAVDHAELARRLGETQTLDQLDEPTLRDRARPGDLRVASIIERLRKNSSTNATRTLEALTWSAAFNASWLRSELLVRALATRRPLTAECLAFLDAQAQPDSVNLHVAIASLCENNSEAAWNLIGRKLADPNLETEFKIAWLRGPILEHRRSAVMLNAAEQWLATGKFERELRDALVQALFDYQPETWYPGREGLPRPPEEKSITAEAATILRRIGKSVLTGNYPASVQSAVRRTLGQLPESSQH